MSLGSETGEPEGVTDTHTYAWSVEKDGAAFPLPPEVPVDGPEFEFVPTDEGTYVVSLTVTDDDGGMNDPPVTETITVTNAPPYDVSPGGPYEITAGDALLLEGAATDPGEADQLVFEWDIDLDQDGVFEATGGDRGPELGLVSGATAELSWLVLSSMLGIEHGPVSVGLRLRVSDLDGGETTSDPTTIAILSDWPTVTSVTAGDGSPQQSMVTSLEIVFDQRVTLDPDNSLTLLDQRGGRVEDLEITNPSADSRTYLVTFSDPALLGGSLPDGWYRLIVGAGTVVNIGGMALADDYVHDFSRFFGDLDGDLDVDGDDQTHFNAAYQTSTGEPGFNAAFDENGDGFIGSDELARFLGNLSESLPSSYAVAMREYAQFFPGDLNGDGWVVSDDLNVIRANWGDSVEAGTLYFGDATGDGVVNSDDLNVVRANWGARIVATASADASAADGIVHQSAGESAYGPARRPDSSPATMADAAFTNWDAAETAWARAIEALASGRKTEAKPRTRSDVVDLVMAGMLE